jgi:hypothetical protein
MSVAYLRNREGDPVVKVCCDGCHRSCTSETLMDVELCRLVSWTFDFGRVRCLLCQWRQSATPEVARRLADQAGGSPRRAGDAGAGRA